LDIAEPGPARRRRDLICALSAAVLLLTEVPPARAQASTPTARRGGLSADEAPAQGGAQGNPLSNPQGNPNGNPHDNPPGSAQAMRRGAPGHGLAGDSPGRAPDPPEITVRGFGPSLTREQEQEAIRDGWKR
jgi:hypothetical protein